MKPANDYAYQQLMGALPRRGAKVKVSDDGLTITALFPRVSDAEIAMTALGTKYPKQGPKAVTVSKNFKGTTLDDYRGKGFADVDDGSNPEGNIITFQFAPEQPTTEGKKMKTIRLTQGQLRSMIREAVDDHHPLESDDNGISPRVAELIDELTHTLADELGGEDADAVIPELHNAIQDCVVDFIQGFDFGGGFDG